MDCPACVGFAAVFSVVMLAACVLIWVSRRRLGVPTPAAVGGTIFLLGAAAAAWFFVGAVPYVNDHPGRGVFSLLGVMFAGGSIALVAFLLRR